MTGISHLLLGSLFCLTVLNLVSDPHSAHFWAALGLGALATLLPDLDAKHSMLQSGLHQHGRATLANFLIGRRQARTLIGGLMLAIMSIFEIGIRMSLQGIVEIFKLFVRHRGILHSLLVAGLLSGLVWYVTWYFGFGYVYALSFLAGFLSHLFLDSLTLSGLAFLRPFSSHAFHLLPKILRIKTKSFGEVIACLTIMFVLLFINLVIMSAELK